MTHKIKIEHRTVEGLLSSLVGGAAVGAFMQRSWVLAATAFLLVVVLLITERRDLKDEDEPVREMDKGLVLRESSVAYLRKMAATKYSSAKAETIEYSQGMLDGSIITAQYVLGTLEDEDA